MQSPFDSESKWAANRGEINSIAIGKSLFEIRERAPRTSEGIGPLAITVLVSAGIGRNLKVTSVINPSVP